MYNEITKYVQNDLEDEKNQRLKGGVVDDNGTVYSRDFYVLLYQDPPGSGVYKKALLRYEDFVVQNIVVEDVDTSTELVTDNLTVNNTISGPTTDNLLALLQALETRINDLESLAGTGGLTISGVKPYKYSEYRNYTVETIPAFTGSTPMIWDTVVVEADRDAVYLTGDNSSFSSEGDGGGGYFVLTASRTNNDNEFLIGDALLTNIYNSTHEGKIITVHGTISVTNIKPIIFQFISTNATIDYDSPDTSRTDLPYNKLQFFFYTF